MKILWIPQLSSCSADGEILLNKDSNMAVLRNMLDSMFCKRNDIVVAVEFSEQQCVIDDELRDNFIFCFNEGRKFSNAYMERFCFDFDFFERIKKVMPKFDIVFVNEPTKVIPLKKIFNDSKVVTYNHWLAFKNMPEIDLRQLEGMSAADMCFVNSEYAADEIYDHCKAIFFPFRKVDISMQKIQPSFKGNIKPLKKDAKPNFIYNHRLSSDIYYARAYEIVEAIFSDVEKEISLDDMPTVYFTNPSGKDFKLTKPYFKLIDLSSQEAYNNFLESKEISCHLNTFFESEGMWSMSTVDCAKAGNACILPQSFGYAEIFDDNYIGYCRGQFNAFSKVLSFIKGTLTVSEFDNSYIRNHSGAAVGNKLNRILQDIAGGVYNV
ncbi:MAG: hypothetical protein J6R68_04030 [Clostridia bacterium]|nr:hypothetical protein [Clostridia bacterium]